MNTRKILLPALLVGLSFVFCSSPSSESKGDPESEWVVTNDFLTDHYASNETVALFQNLQQVAQQGILFGHQDDTAYGVGWWAEPGKSDVQMVCGQYPALIGFDLGDIQNSKNLDGVEFAYMKTLIKEAYARGGVVTLSMHLDNPASGNDAWDNSAAVSTILPGGVNHEKYMATLKLIADFLQDLKTDDGTFIPVILRPYHEHNQSWSWWGVSACSPAEYNELWKMTVEYFRDTEQVHHLLYAISPQDTNSKTEYFSRYPGDAWVDILGLDYYLLWDQSKISHLGQALRMIATEATSRNKVAALTETGIENIAITNWWTNYLLAAFKYSPESRQIAYSLVWRNKSADHHFGPYPGSPSKNNFLGFYADPLTLFEDDLPDMYAQ